MLWGSNLEKCYTYVCTHLCPKRTKNYVNIKITRKQLCKESNRPLHRFSTVHFAHGNQGHIQPWAGKEYTFIMLCSLAQTTVNQFKSNLEELLGILKKEKSENHQI